MQYLVGANMTPDLQQELRALSVKAEQQLKDVPESGSYRRVFSFWAFPSFRYHACWLTCEFLNKLGLAYPLDESGQVLGETYEFIVPEGRT
jgi:hypothetical protein